MAQQTINVGTAPNDGTGTPLRTAFQYTNSNFSELYTAVGPSGNNIVVPGNATITGDLTVDTNTLKVDSANNRVGIGTASPAYLFDVLATGAITATSSFAMARITGASAVANDLTLVGPNTSQVRINFGDTDLASVGEVGYDHSTNRMRFVTNNQQQYTIDPNGVFTWYDGAGGTRMTLNSTGLGVGVTPSAWNSAYRAIEIAKTGNAIFSNNASNNNILFTQNAYYDGSWKYGYTALAAHYEIQNGAHKWNTAPSGTAGNAITWTQAMTLDASGNLLVGDTAQSSNERLRVNNTASNGWAVTMTSTTRGWLNRQSDANGGIAAYFEVGSGNTNVGSINTTSSGTSFVTTSDYRLKEAVQPLVGGLARISALKPSIYKWKVDGSSGEGFLAHELAEVVPFAVTGEKDAVNEDGSIKPQGVDLSKVVPILVAAIQELAARVQTLETR